MKNNKNIVKHAKQVKLPEIVKEVHLLKKENSLLRKEIKKLTLLFQNVITFNREIVIQNSTITILRINGNKNIVDVNALVNYLGKGEG